MLRGPPPLGPGAPPADRIVAFLEGYLGLVDAYLPALLAAEGAAPGARLRTGASAAHAPGPEAGDDLLRARARGAPRGGTPTAPEEIVLVLSRFDAFAVRDAGPDPRRAVGRGNHGRRR
jgi:hypothetical protein